MVSKLHSDIRRKEILYLFLLFTEFNLLLIYFPQKKECSSQVSPM